MLRQKHCHDSPWLLWALADCCDHPQLAHWTHWLVCKHSLTTKHAVVKLEKVQRKLEMHHVCLQSKSCALTLQHISKVNFYFEGKIKFDYHSESSWQALVDNFACSMQTIGNCSNVRATKATATRLFPTCQAALHICSSPSLNLNMLFSLAAGGWSLTGLCKWGL